MILATAREFFDPAVAKKSQDALKGPVSGRQRRLERYQEGRWLALRFLEEDHDAPEGTYTNDNSG